MCHITFYFLFLFRMHLILFKTCMIRKPDFRGCLGTSGNVPFNKSSAEVLRESSSKRQESQVKQTTSKLWNRWFRTWLLLSIIKHLITPVTLMKSGWIDGRKGCQPVVCTAWKVWVRKILFKCNFRTVLVCQMPKAVSTQWDKCEQHVSRAAAAWCSVCV